MNAEFNWWLLIVGLVIGAGLVWLVLADSRRREVDIVEDERASEALWIADAMADIGRPVDEEDVLGILRLHADYLAAGPPDEAFTDEAFSDDALTGKHLTDRAPMAHPVARRDDGEGGVA